NGFEAHAHRLGSSGKATRDVELRIDPMPGCQAGQGEILVRGPNVMAGYFEDEEATDEALRDGWLHTGDIGSVDRRGYLYVVGRMKDVIIGQAGKNVYPAEIEAELENCPLVREACVIGVPAGDTAADGEEYLDCFAGIAVANAGHGHPKVLAAAAKQMAELVHCCTYIYYSPRAGEMCKALADITPGALKKSFLANSGAEAIEGALRLAKQHTGRKEIVALTHSFHGRSYATLSITGNWARKKGGGPYMPGVTFAPAPYPYRCPFGSNTPEQCGQRSAEYLADILRYYTYGDVAAFIAEPVLGEGGIIVPPDNYFKLVKEILADNGILFICYKVQTGFGRTGKMFAIEHYGVEPDIMCMAKGIADGFPLSAFTVTDEIAEAFAPGDHLSTFGGNPVSCAAGLANIQVGLADQTVDDHGRLIPLVASPQKAMAECVEVGQVDEAVVHRRFAHFGNEGADQFVRVVIDQCDVDFVATVVAADRIGIYGAVGLVVARIENGKLALAGEQRRRQPMVVDDVEHAGDIVDLGVVVVERKTSRRRAVVGPAVGDRFGLIFRFGDGAARDHRHVVGQRKRVGIIGSGVVRIGPLLLKSPERGKRIRRILDQILQQVSAKTVHTDVDHVV
ncbi:hypothetical protein LCGC14_2116120, partial [marine sediment metagenome]